MAILPQLVDPQSYRPCDWDLQADPEGLAYWVRSFCEHLDLLAAMIAEEYPEASRARVEHFRADYLATMRTVLVKPGSFPRVDILFFTELRRDVLNRHGFVDPFAGVKRRENRAALELLPEVLKELRELPPAAQLDLGLRNLMAGNIFDWGSAAAADRYRSRGADFAAALADLPARPWFVDHGADWSARCLAQPGYRRALFFVDNAGGDFVLGCIPLCLKMLRCGIHVTLAANSAPALNDVTAPDARDILDSLIAQDNLVAGAVHSGKLDIVATGGSTPLLNLTTLTPECAAAAAGADLVILHGMGRAIESNLHARFRCDVLRSAALKDPAVAERVGGRLFDCIIGLTPAFSSRGLRGVAGQKTS